MIRIPTEIDRIISDYKINLDNDYIKPVKGIIDVNISNFNQHISISAYQYKDTVSKKV